LFVLNQESWFIAPTIVDVCSELSDWFPPNASACTPLVPSGKIELTRTRPAGIERYGEPSLRETFTPADVSLRIPLT
jgi:hypothetical protein